MQKVVSVLARFIGGRKMLLWFLSLTLSALKAKYPDAPLPSESFVFDITASLFAAHSLTDIVAIIKTGAKEYVLGHAVAEPKP